MTAPDRVAVGLVARTMEVDARSPLDLLAVAGPHGFLFEQEGHGLAGRGEAIRVPLLDGLASIEQVAACLDAIATDDALDEPGTGPIAVGALPFRRDEPSSMVIPSLVVGRSPSGRQWVTTVGIGEAPHPPLASLTPETGPALLPDGFTLSSPRSHPEWQRTIEQAVEAIQLGQLGKVVVAREVLVQANRPIVVPDVLERLRSLYPACMVFSVGGFVGASPELLVERSGPNVRCHPLAGTFPRSGDPHADELLAAELLASVKDQREHTFVIDDIVEALGPVCDRLDPVDGPTIMQLRNVLHLGTEISGVLSTPAPTALELVARLHPTPAVGGTPTAAALDWLAQHEGLERGRYAGPVGWVDRRGDGMFAVGIRSAEIKGDRARLFAGVGIVEGSDPQRELIETQLKLQALLAAVVRP